MAPTRTSRRLLAATLAGVVLLTTLLYWPDRAPRTPATSPAPEILQLERTNLVLLAGRLVPAGQTNPFTGLMVEHYPDGSLLSRSAISNGVLQGRSEGLFTNGVVQVVEHFAAGVSHGVRRKFYPSGQPLSEASIANGQVVGTFRRWHENGQLAEEIEMNNGVPHGESRSWYSDGRAKGWATLDQGQVIDQKLY